MDQKKKLYIGGGVAAVLLLLIGAYLLLGRGGGDETATTTPTTGTPTAKGTTPGGGSDREDAATPPGGPAAGTPVNAGGRDPFSASKPAATAAAPPALGKDGKPLPLPKYQLAKSQDPFFITWRQKALPPNVFDDIQPIRLASAGIVSPPPANTELREVPNRRVSGILSGNGVFAILEQNGESEIVKPGSQTNDGYRVVSINETSVKLQRKDGNYLRTQIVPLTDEPTGGQTTGGFGAPAGAGGPGGFPGGGFPGGARPGGGGRLGGGGGAGAD